MFRSITLEVSLKPFKETTEDYINHICREIFMQWRFLLKNREEISIMIWVGDGSEILDYNRDIDTSFEWAYFIGTANLDLATESDDHALSLHNKKRYYTDNPPKMTYGTLKNIVRIFKEQGKAFFPNSKIRIGETFDIGPEFAISDFKYNRHTEICSGTAIDKLRFVDSTALLNTDDRVYAAYPDGIPQDTPFATFLGAQVKLFCADLGFDYIWLSNGLGFSSNPWSLTGKIFDGEKFYAEKLENTSQKVFEFWKLFRESCHDVPIETRGTNNSAGIDYATDGVPLYKIYKAGFNIMPPPNSPWAALNDNYGLEIMGHMTRICELPGKEFLFRYYIHDPWWMNSPWYDRYDGYPSDIYLPMSIARVCEDGSVQSANRLNILSIDNSKGDMPDACVYEPLPHLLKAEKDCADELSFLLWLYPMREYTTAKTQQELYEMYYSDRFIMEGINCGFPLNYVVSTDVFKRLNEAVYLDRIIVCPIIHDEEIERLLKDFAAKKGKILLYGTKTEILNYSVKGESVITVDIQNNPCVLREKLAEFGYDICFKTQAECLKLPAITLVKSNNAMLLSVYNPDTTTETRLKFPLGAPVLLGGETQIEDGYSKYRFTRSEHRECRIYVNQNGGIISAHEEAPVSEKYRRRFYVKGLKDATVIYFPEKYCERFIAVAVNGADDTPILDEEWEAIYDPINGYGFKGRHKTGKLSFLMPFKKYL